MINEFMHLSSIIENLNESCNVLNNKEINDLKENVQSFMQTKNELLQYLNKLASIDQEGVYKIISLRSPSIAGPISHILCYTDLCVVNYEWQFYQMRDFLYPFVKYYKHKAKQNKKCVKELTHKNLIKQHYINNYVSSIDEIENMVKILDKHNSYLGANKALSTINLNKGYSAARELSALSRDIQEILFKLDLTTGDNICLIDELLRILYGKILACAKYIRSILSNITSKMIINYPDWGHIID